MKLTGVMLGTDNPKKLGEFYTKVFGKPVWQMDDWYGFDIDGGSLVIGSHSEVHGKNESPGRVMLVIECDSVENDFAKIETTGAKVIAKPYQPDIDDSDGMWLATFADPDGNYFQLASPWSDNK